MEGSKRKNTAFDSSNTLLSSALHESTEPVQLHIYDSQDELLFPAGDVASHDRRCWLDIL